MWNIWIITHFILQKLLQLLTNVAQYLSPRRFCDVYYTHFPISFFSFNIYATVGHIRQIGWRSPPGSDLTISNGFARVAERERDVGEGELQSVGDFGWTSRRRRPGGPTNWFAALERYRNYIRTFFDARSMLCKLEINSF